MGEERKASLRPSDFASADQTLIEQLREMTCEQAVAILAGKAAAWKDSDGNDEDMDAIVRVPCRKPPGVLVPGVSALARWCGRSTRLITKCVVVHGFALLGTVPGLDEAAEWRCRMLDWDAAVGGVSDLVNVFDRDLYSFMGHPVDRWFEFRAVNWAVSGVLALCTPLQMNAGKALSIASLMSLSTTKESPGLARNVLPEVDEFLRYVGERVPEAEALYKRAQSRTEGAGGACQSWNPGVGIGWEKRLLGEKF